MFQSISLHQLSIASGGVCDAELQAWAEARAHHDQVSSKLWHQRGGLRKTIEAMLTWHSDLQNATTAYDTAKANFNSCAVREMKARSAGLSG